VGEAQIAARIDDTVPGNTRAVGEAVERVANESGVPRHAGETGDLAVRRNLAVRDATNRRVDASVTAR